MNSARNGATAICAPGADGRGSLRSRPTYLALAIAYVGGVVDALLVVLFEKFYSSGITQSMNEITRFLGVPDHDYDGTPGHAMYQRYNSFQRHRRDDREDMLPSTRKVLDEIFCEPNRELEGLVSQGGGWSPHSARTLKGAGYACVD